MNGGAEPPPHIRRPSRRLTAPSRILITRSKGVSYGVFRGCKLRLCRSPAWSGWWRRRCHVSMAASSVARIFWTSFVLTYYDRATVKVSL